MSSTSGIRLIVGLGNPGAEYAATRHNVGAWLVDQLAYDHHLTLAYQKKLHGSEAKVQIAQHTVRLFIPDTYMNESGKAVLAIAHYYKILPPQILIVHDDLDFPVGQIKLKVGGGHGGHNGLRHISQCLHSTDFLRLRIGIEHPGHKERVTGHVLSKPSAADEVKIRQSIQSGLQIIEPLVAGNTEQACHQLHSGA